MVCSDFLVVIWLFYYYLRAIIKSKSKVLAKCFRWYSALSLKRHQYKISFYLHKGGDVCNLRLTPCEMETKPGSCIAAMKSCANLNETFFFQCINIYLIRNFALWCLLFCACCSSFFHLSSDFCLNIYFGCGVSYHPFVPLLYWYLLRKVMHFFIRTEMDLRGVLFTYNSR